MEITKKTFIDALAEDYAITKVEARNLYEVVIGELAKHLEAGNNVALPEIGKFKIIEKPEREGRNPATNEPMTIEAHRVVKFVPCKTLKEAVR